MIWTLLMMAFDAIEPLTAYFQMRIRKAGGEDHPDSRVSGLIPERSGYVCFKAVSAPSLFVYREHEPYHMLSVTGQCV
jgi:hypothetical protein